MSAMSSKTGLKLPEAESVTGIVAELCRHRSVSGDEGGIAAWVADKLRALGLETMVQEVLPDRPNVIGTLDTGRPGPTLLFNGHLDTLPIPGGYTHDPFEPFVRDGRLYGAEINNMKGAVGGMIAAMAALSDARDLLCGRIVLSAVMGECDSLGHGTLFMLENGLQADMAINGEPTDLKVMTCHVGVSQLVMRARGVSVHVCRQSEGRNAFDELLPALAGLDRSRLTFTPHPDFAGLPTINIGKVGGGVMASMLADEAEAHIDVRTVPGMTPEGVLEDIRAAVAQTRTLKGAVPDVEITLVARPTFCQQHPYQADPELPVVQAVADSHAELFGDRPHIGPLYPQVFFGTDASHLAHAGIPTVIYGPGKVSEINVVDESAPIDDLLRAAKVYTVAAMRLCGR